jgi:hypothetical protein
VISSAGHPQLSPADFRAHAEAVLLPLLAQIQQTIASTIAAQRKLGAEEENMEDQLDVYRPQVLIQTYQARLASTNEASSASFITAMVRKINQLVLG